MKNLQEILARKAEIRSLLEGDKEVDLAALETELRELDDLQSKIEQRQRLMEQVKEINAGQGETRTLETFNAGQPGEGEKVMKEAEKRGKALKENRAVTVGSGQIVTPKHTATDIKGTFNQVSSLVDRVKVVPLMGGESYQRGYVADYGTGDYSAEGADYNQTEPTFSYASINKTKITTYCEESEEVLKLPDADYDGLIMANCTTASRKKLTREILVGDGANGHFVGIFSAQATAIDPATDKAIATIDATTLDEIIYSYGGSEDVEDQAVLILNKKDLKAFAKVRTTTGEKVYDIVNNGNTACGSIADSGTANGAYCMAYGSLSNYEMAIFSDMDVQRSTDFKFKSGQIAHKSSIFAGGNVAAKNGFLRVKKAPVA
jgi:HK97 family phage major capsid protein